MRVFFFGLFCPLVYKTISYIALFIFMYASGNDIMDFGIHPLHSTNYKHEQQLNWK